MSPDEATALETLDPTRRSVPKHTSLLSRRTTAPVATILLEGIGARYVRLASNDRQIVAFALPGDAWNLHEAEIGGFDHEIGTLTDCVVAEISRDRLSTLYEYPELAQALRRLSLVDLSIAYAWLTNLGRRSAERRLAHLFCELYSRLKAVGRATEIGFDLPLTQSELADALGLSLVHTNKSLQRLRRMGHFDWDGGRMSIHDFAALARFAEFDDSYLSLA